MFGSYTILLQYIFIYSHPQKDGKVFIPTNLMVMTTCPSIWGWLYTYIYMVIYDGYIWRLYYNVHLQRRRWYWVPLDSLSSRRLIHLAPSPGDSSLWVPSWWHMEETCGQIKGSWLGCYKNMIYIYIIITKIIMPVCLICDVFDMYIIYIIIWFSNIFKYDLPM